MLIGTRFAPESNPYVVFAEFADKPLVLFAASAQAAIIAAQNANVNNEKIAVFPPSTLSAKYF